MCSSFGTIYMENIIIQKRITWWWKKEFSALLELFKGVTQGNSQALDSASFQLLAALKTPRRSTLVKKLFFPNQERHSILLSKLDNEEYNAAMSFLIDYEDTPFYSFEDLANEAKKVGNALNAVCTHISRWVKPDCMGEKHAKVSAVKIWQSIIVEKSQCLDEEGSEDIPTKIETFQHLVTKAVKGSYLCDNSRDLTFVPERWNTKTSTAMPNLKQNRSQYLRRFQKPVWCWLALHTLRNLGDSSTH
ncbi:hypothetical protein BDZ91DRAFT_169302 [Kalaharituber pfeilii]|nr:hypothetical protein BDZ91DRAFT_169302 [Kalaharituber pfeilii]